MPDPVAADSSFDHAYTVVADLSPYNELRSRGYAVPDGAREHPGGVSCRYLPFHAPANQPLGRTFQYLEFVKLSDVAAYCAAENSAREKKGLSLRSEARTVAPGFSLIASALRQRLPAVQQELAAYRPEYEHVNYRWQTETEPDAPGWSYLKFKEDIVPSCELWFTEYDPDPVEVNRHRPVIPLNPNTCNQIVGCIWDLGPPDGPLRARVQRLTGGERRGDELILNRQFTIWSGPSAGTIWAALAHCAPLAAMVLGCASLATFKRLASPDRVIDWNGQEAALLTPFSSGWAIVVVERA
ncbi:MAG TPA: hypothetical protein PLW65_15075 [Pseudomonadota bacterium]|nr:hypothetical protein [Pseudomonadota bacterium]